MKQGSYTVVYDGACRVCTRIADVLRRWGRNLVEVVPSQTQGLQTRFPWIAPHAYDESMQLVGPGGMTWRGAAAIEQLLTILPRGRLVSWVFHVPLVRGVAEKLYRWFARNRYHLGCGDHCKVERG